MFCPLHAPFFLFGTDPESDVNLEQGPEAAYCLLIALIGLDKERYYYIALIYNKRRMIYIQQSAVRRDPLQKFTMGKVKELATVDRRC